MGEGIGVGIECAFEYTSLVELHDATVRVWGQPMTVWSPSRRDMLGYENQTEAYPVNDDEETHEPDETYNQIFSHKETKGLINFKPKRGVFYHYNWFPDKQEELVQAAFFSNSGVRASDYIRTRTIQQVSVYGDMIFRVERVFDEGKYKQLRRIYFLRPVVDQQLANLLVPEVQL
jgi:hypothetical protein